VAARSGTRRAGKPVIKSPSPAGGKKEMHPVAPAVFQARQLRKALGIPAGQPIPAPRLAAAIAGRHGPKAKKQALFTANTASKGK
jgi:hypothetical protein